MFEIFTNFAYFVTILSYNYFWIWRRDIFARKLLKCIPAFLIGLYPYALGDYFLLENHPEWKFQAGIAAFSIGHLLFLFQWRSSILWYIIVLSFFFIMENYGPESLRKRYMMDYTMLLICWGIAGALNGNFMGTFLFMLSDLFLVINMEVYQDKNDVMEAVSINLYWISLWLLK
jgi:uncharacterized membrane protein YhhN